MKMIKDNNSLKLVLSLNSLVSNNLVDYTEKSTEKNNHSQFIYFKDKRLNQNERAGILIGKKSKFSGQIQIKITHVIEDSNPNFSSRYSVERITNHIYTQMEKIKKEHPDLDYIGEWHTHPNGLKQGSFLDHLSMFEMIENPAFGNIFWVILLIFIPKSFPIGYYYDKNNVISIPVKIQIENEV